ncbi:MAG: repair protein [Moraxellaceae bacterium]|jgi:DNA end-binding protein Ku|nr:repair protein [Moraxellaceae bacterium]MDF3030540.1 repair protein [Moraxellaceae bacterium]
MASKTRSAAPRSLWKGAVSFGLIHIPVELYPAEKSDRIDFDMLDKRDFAPVGYKRVNKETGREVGWDDIVKGYEYEAGQYVVVSDEELREANPEAARSIQLLAFVPAAEIPVEYFEQPYVLAPARGGDNVYALLRETLKRSGRIGIAQVVIRTRQSLAALVPEGRRITLMTLRWPHELRAFDESALPAENLDGLDISEREIDMALALVETMSEPWRPQQYKDRFFDDVMALINRKIAAQDTHALYTPAKAKPLPKAPKVEDLMALLRQSLAGNRAANAPEAAPAEAANDPAPAGKARSRRSAAARKPQARAAANARSRLH